MAAVSVAEHRDSLLIRLAYEPTWRERAANGASLRSATVALHENRVLDDRLVNAMPRWGAGAQGAKWRFPQSHLLKEFLEPTIARLLSGTEFRELFDDVEYRLGITQWCDPQAMVWERGPNAGEYVGEGSWWGATATNGPAAEVRFRAALARADVAEAWRPLTGEDPESTLTELRDELRTYRRYA
jgi:hypothetical protein